MTSLVLYFVLSHILSFLCSIFEAVLLSCTATYIALLKKKGSPHAPILEELKTGIDRPLSAILTLNTISHTFGAAGVGASVVELYGDQWLATASVVLTLTMLYWTEMFPKTLGAIYWKGLAPICAYPIKWLIFMTYPFVFSFNIFARLLSRGKKYDRITEDDIRIALDTGVKAGVIEEEEQDMVENIFRLGDRRVGMLMVPRVDIDWIDLDEESAKVRDKILALKHQEYVVCEREIDRVVGTVSARDLLAPAWMSSRVDLRGIVKPPLFVNETEQVFELLDLFKKKKNKMALVTDEYGLIQGLITMTQIMDAIVKDIDQEIAEAGAQIYKVNNRSFVLNGSMPIDEFKEIFHFDHLPDEERARYRTLSGLCMNQLAAVPCKGDIFMLGGYRFEVIQTAKRRVQKVLVTQQDRFP